MPVLAGGGGQQDAGRPGVRHDGDVILGAELVDEDAERLLEQFDLLVHGPGGIDEEDEVAGGNVLRVHRAGLESDAEEPVAGLPGAVGEFAGDGEGLVAGGLRVVVGEVVDELLQAHGVAGREAVVLLQVAAGVGVARAVHVDGERRERVLGGVEELVLLEVGVALVAEGLGVGE